MSSDLKSGRLYERLPGVPRPDPYTLTPSHLLPNPSNSVIDPETGERVFVVNPPIRSPRGDFSIFNITCNGESQKILSNDERRCYFELQNKSLNTVTISFGSSGGQLEIQPLSTWWAPVTPINDVFISGATGDECTILTASD